MTPVMSGGRHTSTHSSSTAQYPHHGFRGTGTVYPLRAGGAAIGTLSISDDHRAVAWQPNPDRSGDPFVAQQTQAVAELLSQGAATGTPLPDTVAAILDQVSSGLPIQRADLQAVERSYERSRRRRRAVDHDCEC